MTKKKAGMTTEKGKHYSCRFAVRIKCQMVRVFYCWRKFTLPDKRFRLELYLNCCIMLKEKKL